MKFSFKKGGGGDKAAPAKRASRSGGNGLASVQAFLVNHLEKLLVSLIAVLTLWFLYSGLKQERIQFDEDDLKVAIDSAKSTIDAQTWNEVRQQRYPEPDTFDQQATADTVAIKDEDFPLPVPLHPILQERQKRRSDPQLIAPLDLEVEAGYGPLAVRPTDSAGAGRMPGFFRDTEGTEKTRPLPPKYTQSKAGQYTKGASPTESVFFVVIKGLVPIQQQFAAYQDAFDGAAEYLPERDTPRYLALKVQRAEVGPDGQPQQWSDLDAIRTMRLEPERWDGQQEEQASPEHIIAPVVMPLPPLKFRDITPYAVHSKIPLARTGAELYGEPTGSTEQDESGTGDNVFDLFGGSGGRMRPEGPVGGEAEDGEAGGEAAALASEVELAQRPKIDQGLLRYFDFTVEPGKSYTYRVQLILEDPNNPREFTRPSTSSCETSVVVRRQQNPSKNFIETPWSEASSTINVPAGRTVLAGSVEQPRMVAITAGNRRIRLARRPGDEPQATVMAVVFDRDRAMDVPAEVRVRRGSVINGQFTTEAVDPAKANIVELEDYALTTNAIVLDIAGGESLDSTGQLRSPGQILLMNNQGELVFHNQVADFQQFEYHTIPEDEELLLQRARDRMMEDPDGAERRGRGRGEGPRGDTPPDDPAARGRRGR